MADAKIDQLSYHYYPKTNQLSHITDAIAHGSETAFGDIATQPTANYTYDELGRLVADSSANYRIVYDAYDNVKEVRTLVGDTLIVSFGYDDGNYRVRKTSYGPSGLVKHTYYFRDAEGNTMGVYELVPGDTLKAVEHTLYSTDRFGTYYRAAGTYAYELKDHLGNVRATIDRWTVDETAQQSPYPALSFMADYYPFGWMMPDRKQLKYRYGYNDQELDEETGWYTFKFRAYDARIARFHRVDPLTKKFPHWTPYQFAGNMPVQNSELEGAEPKDETGSGPTLFQRFLIDPIGTVRDIFDPDHPQAQASREVAQVMSENLFEEPDDSFWHQTWNYYAAAGVRGTGATTATSLYGKVSTDVDLRDSDAGFFWDIGQAVDVAFNNRGLVSSTTIPYTPPSLNGDSRKINPLSLAAFAEIGTHGPSTAIKYKFAVPVLLPGGIPSKMYVSVGTDEFNNLSSLSFGLQSISGSFRSALPSLSVTRPYFKRQLHGF